MKSQKLVSDTTIAGVRMKIRNRRKTAPIAYFKIPRAFCMNVNCNALHRP